MDSWHATVEGDDDADLCTSCGRSLTDDLTGALDRRTWDALASQELAEARRQRRPVALIILDLDRFKGINDVYGHPAGDEVLRAVAALLRDASGEAALVGRYGRYAGDEFLILLPHTHVKGALATARRIQEGIRALRIRARTARSATVTITDQTASIGVAAHCSIDLFMSDLSDLVLEADGALRRAKRNGRNQIGVAHSGSPRATP
ncbi:MAG: GGDEF domain-containing protein [Micromonosporaceae bacterium]